MKKIVSMIQVLAILLMAAIVMTACSGSDDNIINEQSSNPKAYTLSIQASKGSTTTRALSLDGKTLRTTWATTENIYVTKEGSNLGTLSPQTDGATAILKGNLMGDISVKDNLLLTFPRVDISYLSQNGTLQDIAEKYDYAIATVEVSAVNGTNITCDDVTFDNQQAIVKFVLKNKVTGNPIDAYSINIGSYSNSIVRSIVDGEPVKGDLTINNLSSTTWSANGGTGIVFMALRGVSNDKIELLVQENNTNILYHYIRENVTFENGKFYVVTVELMPESELKYISSGNVTIPAFNGTYYYVSGSTTNNYITMKDGAVVILRDVSINLEGSSTNYAPIYCEGNATIFIDDGTTNTLSAKSGNAGIQIGPSGKTLTINGKTGILNTTGYNGAGIGTGRGGDYGNIVINGGVINASGGSVSNSYGAGIGGGTAYSNSTCGNITINGGTITANGGWLSAGIGSSSGTTCGDVIINGGIIVANGCNHAAGIGSGLSGHCGDITIGSGINSVTATTGIINPDLVIDEDTNPVSWDVIGAGNSGTKGVLTIDNITNATEESPFENLNFVISKDKRNNDTWTITHK